MRLFLVEIEGAFRVFLALPGENFEEAWRATFLPFEYPPAGPTAEMRLVLQALEAAEYLTSMSQVRDFRSALSSLLTAAWHMERPPQTH